MNGVRFDSRPQRCTKTGDIKISSVAVGAIGWLDLQSSHSTITPATYLWWFRGCYQIFQASSQSSHTHCIFDAAGPDGEHDSAIVMKSDEKCRILLNRVNRLWLE